jgi:endoglucanase
MSRYIAGLVLLVAVAAPGCLAVTPAGDRVDLSGLPDDITAARRRTFVHAEGTRIVDETGRPLVLRGVNLGNWFSWEGWMWGGGWDSETEISARLADLVGRPAAEDFRRQVWARMVTEKDIARIHEMGFNVVRIPLNHRWFEDGPVAHPPSGVADGDEATQPRAAVPQEAPGWALLDRALDWCEKYHVYAVPDLHSAPGGQSGMYFVDPDPGPSLWQSESCQARTAALWQAIAARYKDRRIVAGYDLLNEPLPPSGRALVRVYERVIEAIRRVDPDHMILLEGDGFSRDFSMFGGRLDANVAYSPHVYTWFGDDRPFWFAQYRRLAARDRAPFWCGEFGENSHGEIRRQVLGFDDSGGLFSGYCYWSWKKTPNHWPGLLEIRAGPRWAAVMDWVHGKWFAPRPTPDGAAQGLRDFLEAIDLDATAEDVEMTDLLR